ncbi:MULTISPECIES: helix-turn-helix transcriptional regulator [unclassified Streptomyces]|uniref:helix-turn-helix transcriptional regulator n=1 Tax=unclassified Streptomyces TaxID=2593676 RepID=UPI000B84B62E|nr:MULTISPECIES: helix-turn-helix transcriptional regulator [unclassified Streptomyces]MYZ38745.1 hypothetical protein [Streptomyces sp. SID4917]
MHERGCTQAELADAVNGQLRSRGYEGTVSDRTVRNWLTGKTGWPHPRQREALGAVFGCTAEDLGFVPPAAGRAPTTSQEQPVRRRDFITATTGTTAAVVAPLASGPPIAGTSDVIRLRSGLDDLTRLDQDRGGHEPLEQAALAGAALRSLGHAEAALEKAEPEQPRPGWIAFYGPAELHALTAIVQDRVGNAVQAEAAGHKALSLIPEEFRRNRAMTLVDLALAQLHQQDIDQACATASQAFDLMAGHPLPGRLRSLLGDFYRDLIALAPTATFTREWSDRYRQEWIQE